VAASERREAALTAALVALVAFLPFLRGALAGACLYFRDLSLHFFPLRRFALEGLRHGELRLWNPLVHEGVPLPLPALGYPLDALGVIAPGEWLISLLLALHVPLGAVCFLRLARGLGLGREAAAGGALVYALGGFYLSTVNLYVYVQAAAWAPLVVLALMRLAEAGGRRALAAAALAVAMALSTTGVEIVAQAVVAGALLGLSRRGLLPASARLAAGLGLGALLCAPVLALVAGQVESSARGQGFAPEVVLAHSLHPFALVQTLVGGLFGNPANLANEWWGQNFFPRGFPYVLSLYLGAPVVALAIAGAASGRAPSRRLVALVAIGLVVALGRWGGAAWLVEASPWLRLFRFPVKAFFTVHLALSLLAALGLAALAEGRRRRTLAAASLGLGALLVALLLLPRVVPGPLASFSAAFLPPGFPEAARGAVLGLVLRDAATGGALALAVALVAFLAATGRLSGARPAWLVLALAVVDLLRVGAGLNPMVAASFYTPSPELAERLPALRQGRVFTCPTDESPAYRAARVARGADHELWSFAVLAETLSPSFNVPLGVPTALSPDLTMLAPAERVLSPDRAACASLPALLPRLREAGVATVLSLDPLGDAELEPLFALAPARIAPLVVHGYGLRDPLPRIALAEGEGEVHVVSTKAQRLELAVETPGPAALVVRDGWAPGWSARIDGTPVAIPRGRHRQVPVPAGRHHVVMSYAPRGVALALGAALAAALAIGFLLRPRRA